jgi:hypothetical protein
MPLQSNEMEELLFSVYGEEIVSLSDLQLWMLLKGLFPVAGCRDGFLCTTCNYECSLLKLLLSGSGCTDCFPFARAATMNIALLSAHSPHIYL